MYYLNTLHNNECSTSGVITKTGQTVLLAATSDETHNEQKASSGNKVKIICLKLVILAYTKLSHAMVPTLFNLLYGLSVA